MSDTNYISSIVKILEAPKQKILSNNILMTKFRAQLPQVRNTTLVHLVFWGNLGRDVTTYYKINDYILVEGYVSVRNKKKLNSSGQPSKQTEISVHVAVWYTLH